MESLLQKAVLMVIKKTRRSVAALATLPLLALAACTSSESKEDGPAGNAEEVFKVQNENRDDVCEAGKEGGSLVYRTALEGAGFDPAVQSANGHVPVAIYGTLLVWNNLTNEYEGDVAESISPNNDNTVWTLTLRDDAVYPDGTAVDSAAVKQNIERYLDPNYASSFTARVAEVTKIETPDPQTVVFNLREPWGTFPWLLTQNPGMIINPKVLASATPEELQANPPANAGAGAFTFSEYKRGQAATVVKKDDWWGGTVCLDDLTINFGTNDAVADYELVQSGGAQAIDTWDAQVLKKTLADDSVVRYEMPAPIVSPILMNSTHPPFNDVRLRKALQLGMDRNLINKRTYEGLALPEGGVVPSTYPFQPTVEPLEFDEAAAKELVKEAAADGVKTDFAYTVNRTPSNENLAILQQALAQNVGMKMKLDMLQVNEWVDKVFVTRNYDSAQGGTVPNASCTYCAFDSFLSTNAAGNVSGFDSPEMDKALGLLKGARTEEETVAALDALQTVFNEEVPQVHTIWLPQYVVAKSNVHGMRFSAGAYPRWEHAYIAD